MDSAIQLLELPLTGIVPQSRPQGIVHRSVASSGDDCDCDCAPPNCETVA